MTLLAHDAVRPVDQPNIGVPRLLHPALDQGGPVRFYLLARDACAYYDCGDDVGPRAIAIAEGEES
jgi:hypothetical protein